MVGVCVGRVRILFTSVDIILTNISSNVATGASSASHGAGIITRRCL